MVTAPAATLVYQPVPRLYPGETVVCLGTGPSLTQSDVAYCLGRARVIAIKDTIRLAPWADCLYACGNDASRWWHRRGDELQDFPGLRYTLDPTASKWASVLRNTGPLGIETDPTGLRTGKNSGAQSINLAVHLGAARIVLLGYDCQAGTGDRDYFYGAHSIAGYRSPFAAFVPMFEALVDPLRALGIQVINASRETALRCFPQMPIEEALA